MEPIDDIVGAPAEPVGPAPTADHGLFTGGDPRRWTTFVVGLAGIVVGVALVITADLGLASWQLLEVGLVGATGLPFSVVAVAEAAVVLALGWAWLGERPGPATWAIALTGGPSIDVLLRVLETPASLDGRLAMLVVGVLGLGTGAGLYLAAQLGPSAQDTVFAGLVRARGLRPAAARVLVDATVAALGLALGARMGVGTLVLVIGVTATIEPALAVGHRLAGTTATATLIAGPAPG